MKRVLVAAVAVLSVLAGCTSPTDSNAAADEAPALAFETWRANAVGLAGGTLVRGDGLVAVVTETRALVATELDGVPSLLQPRNATAPFVAMRIGEAPALVAALRGGGVAAFVPSGTKWLDTTLGNVTALAFGDADGDGGAEVVVATERGVFAKNAATGVNAWRATSTAVVSHLIVADATGAGLSTVTAVHADGVSVHEGLNGAPLQQASVALNAVTHAAVRDVGFDGVADVVVRDATGWHVITGDSVRRVVSVPPQAFSALADFDVDGWMDVVVVDDDGTAFLNLTDAGRHAVTPSSGVALGHLDAGQAFGVVVQEGSAWVFVPERGDARVIAEWPAAPAAAGPFGPGGRLVAYVLDEAGLGRVFVRAAPVD